MQTALRLIADIGATNARIALATSEREIIQTQLFECRHYPDLFSVLSDYLTTVSEKPQSAAIAIANPVLGDWIKMTNHHWEFSKEALRRQFHFDKLMVLNDFAALAMAIPYLQPYEVVQWGGGGARVNAAIGVIGPGSGLGVSGLVWSENDWHPLHSEGGHVTFPAIDEREQAVARILNQKFGHLSCERVVSGPGLENVYRALCELDGVAVENLTSAEITQRALSESASHHDPRCEETLSIFCASLGTIAGDLALTLGALGGVYLGGGILPRILPFFKASRFRERFEAKGRFQSYLAEIPTFVITAETPALIGAMIALEKKAR